MSLYENFIRFICYHEFSHLLKPESSIPHQSDSTYSILKYMGCIPSILLFIWTVK